MATNSYFPQGVYSEQDLYNDLIIESIQIYGHNVYYIPKTIVDENKLLGEQSQARFEKSIMIEMYIETFDGFGGEGSIFQKFGIEIRDQMKLIVSKKQWDKEIGRNLIPRPLEGDLIYLPLSRSLFEIKFVEHEIPYYQLNNLPIHRLDLELFEYNGERFETGIEEIDSFEILYGSGGLVLQVEVISSSSSPVEFIEGETYINQDLNNTSLKLYEMVSEQEDGSFIINFGQVASMEEYNVDQILIGEDSSNTLRIIKIFDIENSTEDFNFIANDAESNNVTIEKEADEWIDESSNKENPFGFI